MDQEPIQPAPAQSVGSQDDVDKAKGTAWLSYIGILWLIPMLTMKENSFAKFHVKQGIVLTIYMVGLSIIAVVPFIGWLVGAVGWVIVVVLSIIGIVKSASGAWWKCPLWVNALADKFKF